MWWAFRKKSSLYKVLPDFSGPSSTIADFWITNIDDPEVVTHWATGTPMPYQKIPQPIVYEVEKNVPFMDLMKEAGGPMLASEQLAKLISRMSSCAVSYDAEVHFEGKVVRTDCKVVQLEASFPCLNMKSSQIRNRIPVRLVIDETKVPPTEHIFRIGETPTTIVCDQMFMDEVASLGMTGFKFDRMLC